MMLSCRGPSTKRVRVRNPPTIPAQTPAFRHLVPACLSDDSKLTIQQVPTCPGDLTSPVYCGHCHKLPLFGKVGGSAMAPVKLFVECMMASYCSLSLRLFRPHTHTWDKAQEGLLIRLSKMFLTAFLTMSSKPSSFNLSGLRLWTLTISSPIDIFKF